MDWRSNLVIGDLAPDGAQLRPNIVWFGEGVMETESAWHAAEDADVFIVCGTSLQVQPAASLIDWTRAPEAFLIDPRPTRNTRRHGSLEVISLNASEGVPLLVARLLGS
jgi:NAD-dependent deacetylase